MAVRAFAARLAPLLLVASIAQPAFADDSKPAPAAGPRASAAPVTMGETPKSPAQPAPSPAQTTTRLLNPGVMGAGIAMVAGGLAGAIVGGHILSNDGSDNQMAAGGAMTGIGGTFVLIGTALAVVGGLHVKEPVATATLRIEPRANGFSLRF